ncbi:T9SS type A sorting domain-containing protein [bacterium]|nr:T9SS type A sorting domain-containing protein [bacterium]
MNISYKHITIVLFCLCHAALAQVANYRVDNGNANQPNEVSIAINPQDPQNIVAASNLNYYYYSKDGGYTWTQDELRSSHGVHGDPCVIFDKNGHCFFGHLANPNVGEWLDRIVVQISKNGGESWSNGAGIGLNPRPSSNPGLRDQDKEWLAADRTNSQYQDNIYMSWTEFDVYGSHNPSDSSRIRFSRSTDHGETWSDAFTISDKGGNCLDGDETTEGAVPSVGPAGEVYIAWSGPEGIMFDRSFDGGQTFGTDIHITLHEGGWAQYVWGINRCNGMPVTACDISDSQFRGNVYILWSDERNGDIDVFMTRSEDRGTTWSTAVKVNNDNSGRDQFFPWFTVDPSTGIIYAIFYDRRNTTAEDTDVYMATSYDGGRTFTDRQISDTSFHPWNSVFFGDYINISAFNGVVHPIWMRMDSGHMTLYTAVIKDSLATSVTSRLLIPQSIILEANYPNPFNPETSIPLTLHTAQHVNLTIYNSKGQQIKVLIDELLMPGEHKIAWNARGQPSGVYLIKLTSDKHTILRKCVLSR